MCTDRIDFIEQRDAEGYQLIEAKEHVWSVAPTVGEEPRRIARHRPQH
ncbi:uncharacterized protein SOCE26_025370 [Sorangium cellulosum]|uniref:Uncharacterized protein n=2 Tax=Sorangium cellulosum TaxID=56 RepID=A0A2L0EPA2_SORCE|nr:uncharacterized protein SOCE26_025370 [Sorangium cellulosum]